MIRFSYDVHTDIVLPRTEQALMWLGEQLMAQLTLLTELTGCSHLWEVWNPMYFWIYLGWWKVKPKRHMGVHEVGNITWATGTKRWALLILFKCYVGGTPSVTKTASNASHTSKSPASRKSNSADKCLVKLSERLWEESFNACRASMSFGWILFWRAV